MTRRTLITSAAGATVGGLMGRGSALAALVAPALDPAPEPVCFQRPLGTLSEGRVVTVGVGRSADLAGVEWRASPRTVPAVEVELRFRGGDGRWSRWVSAGAHGHGPDAGPRSGRLTGDPVWTGGTTTVQVRAGGPLNGARLQLVDVSAGRGARRLALAGGPLATAAALPVLAPALDSGAGQPPIIARRAWAQGVSKPRVAPEYGGVQLAFVHHTENPNGYTPGEVPAMLRAIYAFHRYTNGWNDIGYNFVVDLFGRIFEARAGGIAEPVVGAQAGGYNAVSTGVAVLGSFMEVPISVAARVALERLLAWKLALHGVSTVGRVTVRVSRVGAHYTPFPPGAHVSLPRIAGHRDGDSTDCPGNALYGELPGIRQSVLALAGRPARATLALTGPTTGEQGTPGGGGSTTEASPGAPGSALTGGLAFLDGTAIAGAPVEIQMRVVSRKGEVVREQTLAQVTTQANGRWSLPVAVSPDGRSGTWLRALCPGATGVPAAVSEPLHLPGAASFTPASAPVPTP